MASDESLDVAFNACLLTLRPFSLLPLRGTERVLGIVRPAPTAARVFIVRESGKRDAFDLPLNNTSESTGWDVGNGLAALRHLACLTEPRQLLAAAPLDQYCDEAFDGRRYLEEHQSELVSDSADTAFSIVAQFVRDPLYWSLGSSSYGVRGFVVRGQNEVRVYVRMAGETITRAFDLRLEAGSARAAIGGHDVDELLLIAGPPIDHAALDELSEGVAVDPYCQTAHRL